MTAKRIAKKNTSQKKKKKKAQPRTAAKASRKKTGTGVKTSKKKSRARKKSPAAKKPVRSRASASSATRKTSKPVAARAASTRKKAAKRADRPKKSAGSKKARAVKTGRPVVNVARFERHLRQKQSELLEAYMSAKGNSRTRESDGTEDYIDYAVSSYDREFLLSLTELEQSQLRLVEQAIKRIKEGGFGLCTQCERPIPTKRLEVQPWAMYCVRCQELADRGLTDDADFAPDDEDFDDDDLDEDESDDEEPDLEVADHDQLIGG